MLNMYYTYEYMYGLVYIHSFPYSVTWEDKEAMTSC